MGGFASFTGGLAVGFALLLLRRDLAERVLASLDSAKDALANAAVNAGGAGGAGCVSICPDCQPKVLTPEELAQVPFSYQSRYLVSHNRTGAPPTSTAQIG